MFLRFSADVLLVSRRWAAKYGLRISCSATPSAQERALRKSETKINAELSDLDKSIILKEALLAQIKEGQASYETMQQVGGG